MTYIDVEAVLVHITVSDLISKTWFVSNGYTRNITQFILRSTFRESSSASARASRARLVAVWGSRDIEEHTGYIGDHGVHKGTRGAFGGDETGGGRGDTGGEYRVAIRV